MGTFNNNILATTTGLDLGSPAERWDAFLQTLDVSGNGTISGSLAVTGNVTISGVLTGASSITSLNGIKFVDGTTYANIQAAITAAGSTGSVVIPPGYGAADLFTNPNGIAIADFRGGLKLYKTTDISIGNAYTAWGDSITAGVGASTPAFQFTQVITNGKIWACTNQGISGSQAADQTDNIFATTVTPSLVSTLLTGVNDMRTSTTSATKQGEYEKALLANVVWIALPGGNAITGQSGNAALTYSGSWSSTAAYGALMGKQTTTQNDHVTITGLYGTTLYLTSIAQTSNTATFSVTVDGVSYGSYSNTATTTTILGRNYMPMCVRIGGLTPATHTVVLTKTDAGASPFYFLWAATNAGAYVKTGPQVFVGNCIRFTTAGYGASGGSDTACQQFNTLIRRNCDLLAGDGLSVNHVDASGYYNPDTMASGDGVHPGDTGHALIASAFLHEMTCLAEPRDRGGAKAGAFGSLVQNANGDIYIRAALTGGNGYFVQNNSDVAEKWSAKSFTSNVATGTAPLTVTSTTGVANLSLSGGPGATIAGMDSIALLSASNGFQSIFGYTTELITLSTGASTTDSAANLLPANSLILGVTARVTTTITTATDWKLGDASTAGRFAAANATLTAGTTEVGAVHMTTGIASATTGMFQAAAAKLRITTTGTPGAGVIRVTVAYIQFVPPTS